MKPLFSHLAADAAIVVGFEDLHWADPVTWDLFDLYVETRLAQTLQPGDVIILDNLSSHKSPKAAGILREVGAWFLPLPPYSPDPCVAKNSPPDCFLYAPHQSKWPSPSSKRFCEKSPLAPTTTSGKPSAPSATFLPRTNASIPSKPQDTNPIERDRL